VLRLVADRHRTLFWCSEVHGGAEIGPVVDHLIGRL
jgi:hypothetical protein